MADLRDFRHRYVIQDPARFACLCAAATLLCAPHVPPILVFLAAAATQLTAVMTAFRGSRPGWSLQWGRPVQHSVLASSLAMDAASLSGSVVVGALLLVRMFNGVESVVPLGILAAAVCFLPDARPCRWLLAGDPVQASRQLRDGWSFRDPVYWGAALTAAAVCAIDTPTLFYVAVSLAAFHVNALLVLLDKHLTELEDGARGLLIDRRGRRFLIGLAPFALVPLRILGGDRMAIVGAGAIGAAIVLPDLFRLVLLTLRWLGGLFRMTPATPATYVVLPRQ
jgi:hypothetical protein